MPGCGRRRRRKGLTVSMAIHHPVKIIDRAIEGSSTGREQELHVSISEKQGPSQRVREGSAGRGTVARSRLLVHRFVYSLGHSVQLSISNETPEPGPYLENLCKERREPR